MCQQNTAIHLKDESCLGIAPVCMKYTKRSDDTDLMLMVNELHKVSVFFYIPGRHQSCFPNFAANLFNSIVALVLFIVMYVLCAYGIYMGQFPRKLPHG